MHDRIAVTIIDCQHKEMQATEPEFFIALVAKNKLL